MAGSGSRVMQFRRLTEPLMMEVKSTATKITVPAGYIPQNATAFYISNPNLCYIRLIGTSMKDGVAQAYREVNDTPGSGTNGWLWPPHYVDILGTQHPIFMSIMAVARPGFPLPSEFTPAEISWGTL